MSIESIAAAVAIFIGVGGALIKIIESIINQTTASKFKEFQHDSDKEFSRIGSRINRLERRTAILETRVIGDSDTFSGFE